MFQIKVFHPLSVNTPFSNNLAEFKHVPLVPILVGERFSLRENKNPKHIDILCTFSTVKQSHPVRITFF